MSGGGLLSGGIGIPDGAYRLLNQSQVERAISWLVQNQQTIENTIIQGGGSGTGNVVWCRTNAAGTKITGNGITVSRTSEGIYAYTLDSTIASEAYGVVVTASAEAGNGGDGAVKFQAYDSHLAEDVADNLGSVEPFDLYNPTNNKVYTLDSIADVVYVHDLTNFTTNPTTVSMGSEPLSGRGCLDREGRLLWMGEDGTGTSKHLIAYDTTNGTVYDFGDLAALGAFGGLSWEVIAAEYNSGNPRVWIYNLGPISLKRYSPNLGTEALGAADHSYTGWNREGSAPAVWNSAGTYFFTAQGQYLYQVQAASTGISSYTYPSAYVSPANTAANGYEMLVWDNLRGKLYVPLLNSVPSGGATLLAFTPPAALVNNTGTWEFISNFQDATKAPSVWLDQTSGVMMVVEGNYVHRYLLDSWQLVDTVDVSALTSPSVGTPGASARLCYYSHPYAYLYTDPASSVGNHVRISYQGAELSATGYGAYMSSVLTTMYEITGNSTFNAYLFRSLSPIIRADGEHTVVVVT